MGLLTATHCSTTNQQASEAHREGEGLRIDLPNTPSRHFSGTKGADMVNLRPRENLMGGGNRENQYIDKTFSRHENCRCMYFV